MVLFNISEPYKTSLVEFYFDSNTGLRKTQRRFCKTDKSLTMLRMHFSFHFCTCFYSIIVILPLWRINQKIMTVQLEAVRHLPQIDMFCFIHSSPPAAFLLSSPDFLSLIVSDIVSEWCQWHASCLETLSHPVKYSSTMFFRFFSMPYLIKEQLH